MSAGSPSSSMVFAVIGPIAASLIFLSFVLLSPINLKKFETVEELVNVIIASSLSVRIFNILFSSFKI